MAPSTDPRTLDAIAALLPPLLDTLERIGWVQRQLFPPLASRLAEQLAPAGEALEAPLRALEAVE